MSHRFKGSIGTPMTTFRPRAKCPYTNEQRIPVDKFLRIQARSPAGVRCPVCKSKAKRVLEKSPSTLSPDLFDILPMAKALSITHKLCWMEDLPHCG